MVRERVIVRIEDTGQAARVEESVATGYCDTIRDNLTHWIAVEEDILDSYSHPALELQAQAGKSLAEMADESRKTIATLHGLLKSFESLQAQRTTRVKLLNELSDKSKI